MAKFDKNLGSADDVAINSKLNKKGTTSIATQEKSTCVDSFSFLLKSLWVHSATGKRTKILKDLIKQKACTFCEVPDFSAHTKFLLKKNLDNKYLNTDDYFHSKITADVMYNEPRHFVTIFKDYLIFDDQSEYLKRFYTTRESHDRLPRACHFYHTYNKVFPTFIAMGELECKYMFKNIERK